MNDDEKTKQFLAGQEFMVVAVTLPDGTPWATPVKIQRWEGNEFEWDSKLDTEHSKALESQPIMAVTIFEKKDDAQIGVYMKGHGELLETKPHEMGRYRFTAEVAWLNDETFVKREVGLG